MKKIEARASISPDRGSDEIGVVVQLDGHRSWLTIDEAATLERILGSARFVARTKEIKR